MVSMLDIERPKTPGARLTQPLRPGNTVAGAARFAGVVLMLAAVGIWIISVPLIDSGMLALRFVASVFFMCLGLMLLQVGRVTMRDELHLDRKAGALRHVQRGRDGIARLRQEVALADLGQVDLQDETLTLHDRAGAVILVVSGLPRDQVPLILRALQDR